MKSFDSSMEVFSAGTEPSDRVHPNAVKVMQEIGIDLTAHYPEKVNTYLDESFDYVITVCGHANENCPVFLGQVKQRLHIGFEDPAEARGTEEEVLSEFRRIRDEIREGFKAFYRAI